MKSPKHIFQTDRRRFFKKAVLLGTAGVAGAFGRSSALPCRTNASSARPSARGYRLTAHIRRYYARASL